MCNELQLNLISVRCRKPAGESALIILGFCGDSVLESPERQPFVLRSLSLY